MSRSRGWIVVINNYTEIDMAQFVEAEDYARYGICGFEVGESGTPHMQCYVYFDNARTMKSVKKMFPRAHLEVARASGRTAYRRSEYCTKDGDFYEFGEEPTPGRITADNLDSIMANPRENFHLYNQYRRSYAELLKQERKGQQRSRKIHLISNEDIYKYAQELSKKGTVSIYPNDYEDEDYVISPCYHNEKYVMPWLNGFPVKEKNGYEWNIVDPDIIIFYPENDDKKQYSYLKKKYHKYIEYDGLLQKEIIQNEEILALDPQAV